MGRQETDYWYGRHSDLCPEVFSIQPNCMARTHYACWVCFIIFSRLFSNLLIPPVSNPFHSNTRTALGCSTGLVTYPFIITRYVIKYILPFHLLLLSNQWHSPSHQMLAFRISHHPIFWDKFPQPTSYFGCRASRGRYDELRHIV